MHVYKYTPRTLGLHMGNLSYSFLSLEIALEFFSFSIDANKSCSIQHIMLLFIQSSFILFLHSALIVFIVEKALSIIVVATNKINVSLMRRYTKGKMCVLGTLNHRKVTKISASAEVFTVFYFINEYESVTSQLYAIIITEAIFINLSKFN